MAFLTKCGWMGGWTNVKINFNHCLDQSMKPIWKWHGIAVSVSACGPNRLARMQWVDFNPIKQKNVYSHVLIHNFGF